MKTLFRRVLHGERGVGMVMVVAFMGLCVPILTGALAMAGTFSKDSQVKTNLAKSQYSSIGAFEYIRYLSDDPDEWNKFLEENRDPVTGEVSKTITVGDHEIVVEADVGGYADYGFLSYCIFGTTSVHVKENSTINDCSIGSNGDVTIKEDSVVNGNITSRGNVVLKENVHVYGSVTAAGTVTLSPGASVSQGYTQGVSVEAITGPTPNYDVTMTLTNLKTGAVSQEGTSVEGSPHDLTFNLEAGVENKTIQAGDPCDLTPGEYGTVEVKENATLCLSSGEYAFDEIRIMEGVTINLNVGGGAIIFDAVTVLEFKENVAMNVIGGSAADVVIRVANQAHFKEDGQYLGTYFGFESAYAEMHVKENSTLTGALYGDTVEVKENTVVEGEPASTVYLSFFGS